MKLGGTAFVVDDNAAAQRPARATKSFVYLASASRFAPALSPVKGKYCDSAVTCPAATKTRTSDHAGIGANGRSMTATPPPSSSTPPPDSAAAAAAAARSSRTRALDASIAAASCPVTTLSGARPGAASHGFSKQSFGDRVESRTKNNVDDVPGALVAVSTVSASARRASRSPVVCSLSPAIAVAKRAAQLTSKSPFRREA
mmetsp:Transcript_39680/g.122690  ORF Transcript_39680/g.122690 Transcript_39680/m.122690 type:complete len:201 (-) Transcript_39680:206-808(-)